MRILFLGEGALEGPARYLAAVLTWAKIPFDHLPDQMPLPVTWQKRQYSAVVLSDYRYRSWTLRARKWLIESVQTGMGLIMIGGWASFSGKCGGYAGTDIEQLLPVRCQPGDDRVNKPAVIVGPGVSVVVNGYHRCRVRPGTKTILEFRDLKFSQGQPVLGSRHPALVTGTAGFGRTVTFLTDCAPHWAGGLVDWGKRRIEVNLGHGCRVEIGDQYLKFFRHWLFWLTREV